jgi:NTE family protein
MEERGIEAEAIAGCSMGGIVGALIAHGLPSAEIQQRFEGLDTKKLLDRSRTGGLMGGKGVAEVLSDHLPLRFEDLKIPLRVTAVDVQSGRLITLFESDLIPALRATSALPGIFSPVEIDDRILVDGGLLSNVPVDEMRTMTREPVVAVDVTVPANRRIPFEDNRSFWEKVKEPIQTGKRPLILEVMMKAFDIPAAVLNDLRLAAYKPDYLIKPDLDPDLKVEDFKRLDEAIEAGYAAANETFDRTRPPR